MKQIKILIIIIAGLVPAICFSQGSPEGNLQKYWKYRERLKNFVVVGNCQGCSSPATARDITTDEYNNTYNGPGWSDATDHLGYYIGMLATEYKLLYDQINLSNDPNGNNSTQLQETKKELYYALEKFNTLDCWAEWLWTNNYAGVTVPYMNECLTEDYGTYKKSLNGFFVRDDIPFYNTHNNTIDFGDYFYDGDLIENKLTSSLVPLPDGYKAKDFTNSAFHTGIVDDEHGPREESLDHVIRLMEGWALVSKCIPNDGNDHFTDENGLHTFTDANIVSSFVQEAKNQCARVISWMAADWNIHNPTYPGCSMGVCGETTCSQIINGNCNGACAEYLQYGFSCAEWCITNSFPSYNGSYYSGHYFPVSSANEYIWKHILSSGGSDDQFQKIFELAAMGRVWDENTSSILSNNCGDPGTNEKSDRNHIPLLYDVLWPLDQNVNCSNSVNFGNDSYECLLDVAPCNGTNRHFPNGEWGNEDRVLNGSPSNTATYLQENYGVDYMLYFNLFQIINPSYSDYRYIKPQELCPVDIIKGNWAENDKKNFLASNSITAGNMMPNDYDYVTNTASGNYTIENDNDPNQDPSYRRAQVTFTAGHVIDLMPGFEAKSGVFFDASIDATLSSTQCEDVSIGFGHCPTDGTNPYGKHIVYDIANDSSETILSRTQSKISINPNPNNGNMTVSYELPINTTGTPTSPAGRFEVYNQMGEKLFSYSLYGGKNTFSISRSELNQGIYFYRAISGDKLLATDKIVVIK